MESEDPSNSSLLAPCSCSCICCSTPSSTWRRSIKRKLEQLRIEEEKELEEKKKSSSDDKGNDDVISIAWVEIENEAVALREALCRQQLSIKSLHTELDKERSSSATAASEAMSMILRLQREKAEIQMELRQFKRFAEEKASHDQEEIAALEDLIFKKDQAILSLSYEVEAYRHRLLSCGFGLATPVPSEPQTPDSIDATDAAFDYPRLWCNVRPSSANNEEEEEEEEEDVFQQTPRDQIQNIQQRIVRMERMPSSSHDKGVVGMGFSPRRPWHLRRLSVDSYGNPPSSPWIGREEFPVLVDQASEKDDANDRVYTVDAVHGAPDDYVSTPREFLGVGRDKNKNNNDNNNNSNGGVDEGEIKRLFTRMQALEADRESMRQTIMSMGKDKAQIVLLKEIAQQLCKEVSPSSKKVVKKPSFISRFSIMSAIKWVASFVSWKKKSSRVRYTIGMSEKNVGLLLLLEKSTWTRQKRCLTRTLR